MIQCRSDEGVWAGQAGCGWSGVAGVAVGGAFDVVGVVAGAFDRAGAGAVSTWLEPVTQEFGDGVGDSGVQALRG